MSVYDMHYSNDIIQIQWYMNTKFSNVNINVDQNVYLSR